MKDYLFIVALALVAFLPNAVVAVWSYRHCHREEARIARLLGEEEE